MDHANSSPRIWLRAGTRSLALLLGAGWLAGCSLAPGGHIPYRADIAPIDDLVDIQPITPGLVATYRREISQASAMSESLRQAMDSWIYRIGPGDVLSIIVYDHPELTIPAGSERSATEAGNLVQQDGTIFYPFIGRVRVAGMTQAEVQSMLSRRLAEYLTEPQVEVRVADYRSQQVLISGAVGNPGPVPITNEPLTLADALSQVGGLGESANWHEVRITRDGQQEVVSAFDLLRNGDQRLNRLLRDGDAIHVPTSDSQAIAMMGEVGSPGYIPLGNERLSLTDALARAGGLNREAAEPTGIFVIRGQEEGDKLATVYQLDITNAVALNLGSRFTLQPSDVVYVTAAPLARWNRVISLILPSARLPGAAASSVGDLRNDL